MLPPNSHFVLLKKRWSNVTTFLHAQLFANVHLQISLIFKHSTKLLQERNWGHHDVKGIGSPVQSCNERGEEPKCSVEEDGTNEKSKFASWEKRKQQTSWACRGPDPRWAEWQDLFKSKDSSCLISCYLLCYTINLCILLKGHHIFTKASKSGFWRISWEVFCTSLHSWEGGQGVCIRMVR